MFSQHAFVELKPIYRHQASPQASSGTKQTCSEHDFAHQLANPCSEQGYPVQLGRTDRDLTYPVRMGKASRAGKTVSTILSFILLLEFLARISQFERTAFSKSFEQAIVNFTNALKINPKSSDALGNRAVAYTAIGDEEKSETDKIEAIKMGAPPDGINSILDYVRDKRKNSNPFKK